jgi:DNA-binding PadR family transcriptional regulator
MTSMMIAMPPGSPRRSALAVAVLGLLYEEPMHPYRMQQLIKERGKEDVVNVRQRASIYQMIDRLQRDGLIKVRETGRDENWPERTVYELTADGRRTLTRWMRDMLSTPSREFPDFPAAVAFVPLLEPADAATQFEARAAALERELARIEEGAAPYLPRLFTLEDEYRVAVLRAELSWVRAIGGDLRAGRITWNADNK